jgi:hypothetical protein
MPPHGAAAQSRNKISHNTSLEKGLARGQYGCCGGAQAGMIFL